MTAATPPRLLLSSQALDGMRREGRQALPRETGGILIGFRTSAHVVVTRASLVPDATSSTHDYRLGVQAANTVLDALRHGSDDPVGYVGDWHTHPAPLPPSALDEASLRRAAAASGDTIAMLVISFDATGHPAQNYAQVGSTTARRLRRWPLVTLTHAIVEITDLTAKDLESSARTIHSNERAR